VATAPVGTQVAEHLCLVAAGLPPEDPNARTHFKPFVASHAHVLHQLRQALDAAKATPVNMAATAGGVAATPPVPSAAARAVVPCRGRLSLVLRHVLEVRINRR
jgi:hypothetical protein